jgi:hypothetical protein
MATSLLFELLESTHNFTEAQFALMSDVKRRLLRAELYEALNRDDQIMPLLVQLIKDNKDNPNNELFRLLQGRIRENFEQFPQTP